MIEETVPGIVQYTGTIPDKSTQTPVEFANNVYPFHLYVNNTFVPQVDAITSSLNILSSEINQTAQDIYADKGVVVESKNTVLEKVDHIDTVESRVNDKYNVIASYVVPPDATYNYSAIDAKVRMSQVLTLTNSI